LKLFGIRTGNVKLLEEALNSFEEIGDEDKRAKNIQLFVRHVFGDNKLTSLHLAAEGGHR
jgi:hypothetical protein